ncbi:unnamed protein product, partial [Closterium sp. NIES-53]
AHRGGFGGSQRQQQLRSRETRSVQQLREWYAGRGRSGGVGPCTYVLHTGNSSGKTWGLPHTTQRCFSRLNDAWRARFPDTVELPRWHDLLLQNVPICDLDSDAILAAMYAFADSDEGDCYLSVPPDPGIAAAALGASASAAPGTGACAAPSAGESALSGTAPTESLQTFTLDSGASRSFFRDNTTLTPLSQPVAVSIADPSWGPVLAHSSTVLPCPAAPSGLLSGLHLPSLSTNLVSGADLQDAWVDQFTPGGQRVTHCTCSRTGRHLATFTRRPGSSLYTLTTTPPPVSASGQVAASGQVFAIASRSSPASAPCSCRPLSHETLLCHHRLGHPSLPRLRGMASRALVSGLPRSLSPLPPGPAPTCVPCVEGQHRAAPHSSSFPPTEAPLQTLNMDVWGPARVCGQGHERYFLLVVDDYSRYTTVFPLRSKDRGGEFSSDLLRVFCRSEGIRQTFTLPASPQQNGIAERCIGMVMDVTRTSMIHAAALHFLWPFAVQYAAHQINLLAGDHTYSAVDGEDPAEPIEVAVDSGATRGAEPAGAGTGGTEPGVFVSGGAASGGAEPGRVEPEGTACGVAEPARAESGGAPGVPSRREPLSPQQLREWYSQRCRGATGAGGAARAAGGVAGAAIAAGGAAAVRAAGGAPGAGGVAGAGATAGAAGGAGAARAAGGAAGAGVAAGAGAAAAGGAGAGGAGAAGAVGGAPGTGGVAGAGAGAGAAGGAARAAGSDTGAGGAIGAGAPGAAGGAARPRPYYVPLLQQVLGSPRSRGPPPFLSPPPVQSQSQLQPASRLPGPSPYSGPTRGLTERREPESRPVSPESRSASPVRTVRAGCVSRTRPPPVPGTHSKTLHPSTAPQCVPLPSPPASSLPVGPDLESDSLRAASPTDYATSLVVESASVSVCPPSVGGECALGTDVLEDRQEDFECFATASPHLVSMLIAPEGDPDALDIPTPRSYAEAIEGPYSSKWQAAMDTEMASWKSTGTYVDEVPPPGANIVSGMWIFRVKRLPGSPPVFKARYVARGFSPQQGVDFFQTFSPTPKMTTLRALLHVAVQRDYELHLLDFSTAFLQGSLHKEIWLRHPPGFTGSFQAGTEWSLRRPVYGLRQAPREWHDTLRMTLAALGFAPSTSNPSLFLRTDTTLPSFYVLVYVDDLVFATADTEALAHVKSELQKRHTCTDLEPSGPYPKLVGCLMYLMTCTRPDLAYPLSLLARYVAPGRHRKVHWDAAKRVLRYLCSTSGMGLVLGGRARVVLTGHADASWVDDLATQRSSQGYTFSLGSGSVSWRAIRSSSVLSSYCEAEIYAGALAAQELRWLTYLLTNLGEVPRSPPVLYIDNKAMLALCQEHRTKHIALRYFLAQELQQRGQLRLAYVASQANTVDVFTKALEPCDHQHFCTVLGLVPTVPHLLTS